MDEYEFDHDFEDMDADYEMEDSQGRRPTQMDLMGSEPDPEAKGVQRSGPGPGPGARREQKGSPDIDEGLQDLFAYLDTFDMSVLNGQDADMTGAEVSGVIASLDRLLIHRGCSVATLIQRYDRHFGPSVDREVRTHKLGTLNEITRGLRTRLIQIQKAERRSGVDVTRLESRRRIECSTMISRIEGLVSQISKYADTISLLYDLNDDNNSIACSGVRGAPSSEQSGKVKPYMKLLMFVLEQLSQKRARKDDRGNVYLPLYIRGVFSRHFRHPKDPDCTIKSFIFDCVNHHVNHDIWTIATERQNVAQVEAYLTDCTNDSRIPLLKTMRHIFSFRNGVFDASVPQFYHYEQGFEQGDSIQNLSTGCISSKFIDQDFDWDTYVRESKQSPLDIFTPNVDQIIAPQQFPDSVRYWMFACLGRMLFEVGSLDKWQFAIYFKGIAGTGKSTLLKLVSKLFPKTKVGTLMSRGQEHFQLEHLADKDVVICFDVGTDMNLDQTKFQQMVSQERISIHRKNKISLEMVWKSQIAFAGNCYPPWKDKAGEIARRLLLWDFDKLVGKSDPHLGARCVTELPAFLAKAVGCYHHAIAKYGDEDVWSAVPKYFFKTRTRMQSHTNTLQGLLVSDDVKVDIGEHCSWSDLQNCYREYCRKNRMQRQLLDRDFTSPIFGHKDILVVGTKSCNTPRDFNLSQECLRRGIDEGSLKYTKRQGFVLGLSLADE